MDVGIDLVEAQEVRRPAGMVGRLGVILGDADDVDIMPGVQPRRLERLEGTGRLHAPVVGDQDGAAVAQLLRHRHDRARAVREDFAQRLARGLLGLEVEVGPLTQKDQVVPLRLQQDLLPRQARILQNLGRDAGVGASEGEDLQELLDLPLRLMRADIVPAAFVVDPGEGSRWACFAL